MILTDADQLREALLLAIAERDDLRSRLAALQETNAATMRVVAEGQREACAEAFKPRNTALAYYQAADIVLATPLVTEGEP